MRPTRGYIGWARSTGDFFPLRFPRDHGGLFLLPGEERGKSSQRQVANGCSVYYEDYKTQSRNTELVEWLCCSLPKAWLAFFYTPYLTMQEKRANVSYILRSRGRAFRMEKEGDCN